MKAGPTTPMYSPTPRLACLSLIFSLATAIPLAAASSGDPCAHRDPLRQPFFGTTHLHTGLSFDAAIRFVPSTPDDAYRFARGLAPLPGVGPWGIVNETMYTNPRPLDWGMVTDHAEQFGEIGICLSDMIGGKRAPDSAYYSLDCQMIRGFYYKTGDGVELGADGQPIAIEDGSRLPPSAMRTSASNAFTILGGPGFITGSMNSRMPLCESGAADCDASGLSVWKSIQESAHDHNEPCEFTTFVAYEAASTPSGTNWHRNVIFRNENVIETPITAIDMAEVKNPDPNTTPPQYLRTPAVEKLWDGLRDQCLEATPKGGLPQCDVLTIPHNSNLGGGVGNPDDPIIPPLFFDPRNAEDAANRQQMEPLVEIFQDKGSSECRYDPRFAAGVGTSDELCNFEILDTTSLQGASGVGTAAGSGGVPPEAFNDRAFVRNVLKDGLAFQQQYGVNPFKLGIVAASDSHNGSMGWHPENSTYEGHEGIEDAIPVQAGNNIQNNSGGYSVVWAEENTRDAIFDAMKRRETYGTSGTRPVVRFFAGWGDAFNAQTLCKRPDRLADAGYTHGVPMGGDLDQAPSRAKAGKNARPVFLFSAYRDDNPNEGALLQRVQLVKGWLDAEGNTHEKVIDVAGGPNDAWVNRDTCEPTGAGHEQLCGVWVDKTFDANQAAFYYLRVLENPVCRYSTHICRDKYQIDPLSTGCANGLTALAKSGNPADRLKAQQAAFCCNNEASDYYVQPVIQERAWTSPVWYSPASDLP
ncbi:MAG: DUF3604 domain-containing protein [Deltaproteobacteria bacterium]|nr:DUF3604 domain-containing protein [Deltaproteobacteria bacterium]